MIILRSKLLQYNLHYTLENKTQILNLVRNIFFSISFSTENERNIHTQRYKLRCYFYEMGNIFHSAITQSHSEWLTHLQLNAFIIFVETEWGKRRCSKKEMHTITFPIDIIGKSSIWVLKDK